MVHSHGKKSKSNHIWIHLCNIRFQEVEARLDQKNSWCEAEVAEQERLGATSMKVDEVLARHEVLSLYRILRD